MYIIKGILLFGWWKPMENNWNSLLLIEKKIILPYNQGLQSCEETYMIEIMGKKFLIV